MKKIPVLATTLFLAALLASCQTPMQMPWQKSSQAPPVELLEESTPAPAPAPAPVVQDGLAISPQQRFKDVPLPLEVKEDFERSYVYESPTLQIGRMVYTSKASVNELANFYIKEAPTTEWILQSAMQAEGGQTLIFTKQGKRLEVKVQEQGIPRPRLLILNLTPDTGSGL